MAAPPSFGTAFAVAGFSFDPNLSPNNQGFSNAVYAVIARNGQNIETIIQPFLPGGGTALGTGNFANPTNKVSGTATNGTSTLAMRSDGAPALDWAQSPTWTGVHTFGTNPTLVVGTGTVILCGTATAYAWGGGPNFQPVVQFGGVGGILPQGPSQVLNILSGIYYNGTAFIFTGTGTDNTGTSTGVRLSISGGGIAVQGGASGTNGQTATLKNLFAVNGTVAPTIQGYGPTAAALADMTPDVGTFGFTVQGITPAVTGTATWAKQGSLVVLTFPTAVGTSNATTCTITGIPAVMQPTTLDQLCSLADFEDNTLLVGGSYAVNIVHASSTWSFQKNGTAAGFVASGQKGTKLATIAFSLQ